MQKQEVETGETGRKVCFLESALEGEEEKGHFRAEMGQAHYTTAKRGQRRGGGMKVGPRGAGPGARAPGARPRLRPCQVGPAFAYRQHSRGGWWCGGAFTVPGHAGASHHSYIREGTPHNNTHSTQHTTHSSTPLSHSLTPVAQGAPSLPQPHSHLVRLD
jgi:hypothetical protein